MKAIETLGRYDVEVLYWSSRDCCDTNRCR